MDLYVRPCVSSTCLIYAVSYAVSYSYTVRYTVRFKRVPNGQEGSIRFIMVQLGLRTLVKGQGDSRSFNNTKESLIKFKKVK